MIECNVKVMLDGEDVAACSAWKWRRNGEGGNTLLGWAVIPGVFALIECGSWPSTPNPIASSCWKSTSASIPFPLFIIGHWSRPSRGASWGWGDTLDMMGSGRANDQASRWDNVVSESRGGEMRSKILLHAHVTSSHTAPFVSGVVAAAAAATIERKPPRHAYLQG